MGHAAAGLNSLAVTDTQSLFPGLPSTRPSPHYVAPAQHTQGPTQGCLGNLPDSRKANVLPTQGHQTQSAEYIPGQHVNVFDQSGNQPVNFGNFCVSSEPIRADFLISRSRRLCLIVNLEPGPFEVHG